MKSNKKYKIKIVKIDKLGEYERYIYTAYLYKRVLWFFWKPVFGAQSTTASVARDICREELLRLESLEKNKK